MPIPIFVISGPSGCGKTTVSQKISTLENFAFVEGDALHPKRNIDKMSAGVPLTDDDRWEWLRDVRTRAEELARRPGASGVVITCSALKRTYRQVLLRANHDHDDDDDDDGRQERGESDVVLFFIFLDVSKEELIRRMETRKGHYMKRGMLESQLRDLEMPADDEPGTYRVDANKSVDETENGVLKIVASLLAKVNRKSDGN